MKKVILLIISFLLLLVFLSVFIIGYSFFGDPNDLNINLNDLSGFNLENDIKDFSKEIRNKINALNAYRVLTVMFGVYPINSFDILFETSDKKIIDFLNKIPFSFSKQTQIFDPNTGDGGPIMRQEDYVYLSKIASNPLKNAKISNDGSIIYFLHLIQTII